MFLSYHSQKKVACTYHFMDDEHILYCCIIVLQGGLLVVGSYGNLKMSGNGDMTSLKS